MQFTSTYKELLIRFRFFSLIHRDLDSFGQLFWDQDSALNLERTGGDGKRPNWKRRVIFSGLLLGMLKKGNLLAHATRFFEIS